MEAETIRARARFYVDDLLAVFAQVLAHHGTGGECREFDDLYSSQCFCHIAPF